MPNKIKHPIRDKIIRNEKKLIDVVKKELKYEEQKNNIFKLYND
jgi:hypothetical protein